MDFPVSSAPGATTGSLGLALAVVGNLPGRSPPVVAASSSGSGAFFSFSFFVLIFECKIFYKTFFPNFFLVLDAKIFSTNFFSKLSNFFSSRISGLFNFSLKILFENFLWNENTVQLNIGDKTFLGEKTLFQTFFIKDSGLFFFSLEKFLSKQNIVPTCLFRPADGNRP